MTGRFRIFLVAALLLAAGVQSVAKAPPPEPVVRQDAGKERRRIVQGFDGGMMVHTGYLRGSLDQIGYDAKGLPVGIGGVLRLHLGKHFRVGGEAYMSNLNQKRNGSKLKYFWGGLVLDTYMNIGRLQPYLGFTVGGGAMTTLLMTERPESAWAPVDGTFYNKQGFFAVDPFVGFDVTIIGPVHLTLKADYLFPVNDWKLLPHGPRVYLGIIFHH